MGCRCLSVTSRACLALITGYLEAIYVLHLLLSLAQRTLVTSSVAFLTDEFQEV